MKSPPRRTPPTPTSSEGTNPGGKPAGGGRMPECRWGRRSLLVGKAAARTEAGPGSALSPGWFCDFSKATSPDSQAKAQVKPLSAPFGTDDGASWDRDKCCPDKQVTERRLFLLIPSFLLFAILSSPIPAFGWFGISFIGPEECLGGCSEGGFPRERGKNPSVVEAAPQIRPCRQTALSWAFSTRSSHVHHGFHGMIG